MMLTTTKAMSGNFAVLAPCGEYSMSACYNMASEYTAHHSLDISYLIIFYVIFGIFQCEFLYIL